MKGYKAFNPDWTCRDFQYKVGETYTLDGKLAMCKNGFHFCQDLINCYSFYLFNSNPKIAEIEALGDIETGDNKNCTNRIKIIREIFIDEQLEIMGIDKENYLIFIKIFNIIKDFYSSQLGGYWFDGATDGPLGWYLYCAPSYSDRSVGGRATLISSFLIDNEVRFSFYRDDAKIEISLTKDIEENKNRFKKVLNEYPEDEKMSLILNAIIKNI